MGKTKRKIKRWNKNKKFGSKEIVKGDDTQLNYQKWKTSSKIEPYAPKGEIKFEPEYNNGRRNNSKQHKLEIKNANRSLKKSIRQKLKQDLRDQLDNL